MFLKRQFSLVVSKRPHQEKWFSKVKVTNVDAIPKVYRFLLSFSCLDKGHLGFRCDRCLYIPVSQRIVVAI